MSWRTFANGSGFGALFVIRYALASWRAARIGGHWYRDNAFEVAARQAAVAVRDRRS